MSSGSDGNATPSGAHWENALLAEAAWVRRLAARLLGGDGPDAEDLAQSVLTGALEKRPSLDGGLRRWLAVVTQRLAGKRRRTLVRQPAPLEGPVPSGSPGPGDAVERLEQHQWLLEHVTKLPEPYRTAIVERYLEERTVQQIAERHRLGDAAVRKQLSRGVAMLRARVEGDPSTDGRSRLCAIVGLPAMPVVSSPVDPTSTVPWIQVALVMKTKLVLAAAVLLAASLWSIDFVADEPPKPKSDGAASQQVASRAGDLGGSDGPIDLQTREGVVSKPEVSQPNAEAPGALRILDAFGEPVADVFAALIPKLEQRRTGAVVYARSDREGRLEWPVGGRSAEAKSWTVVLGAEGRPPLFEAIEPPALGETRELVFGGTGELQGTVTLRPGAAALLEPGQALLPTHVELFMGFPDDIPSPVWRRFASEGLGSLVGGQAKVDPSTGRFRFRGMDPDRLVVLRLPQVEPFLFDSSSCRPGEASIERVRFPLGPEEAWLVVSPAPLLTGRIVFDDGSPVVDASVFLRPWLDDHNGSSTFVYTGEDGRFAHRVTPESVPPRRWLEFGSLPRLVQADVAVSHPRGVRLKQRLIRFPNGPRIGDIGELVMTRRQGLHFSAEGPDGRPAQGVRVKINGVTSARTDAMGRTRIACSDASEAEEVRAGGGDYLVDRYPVLGGTGSVEDPLRIELAKANTLVLKLVSDTFEPADVQIETHGPHRLFHGSDEDQVFGTGLHRGAGVSLFRGGGERRSLGLTERHLDVFPKSGLVLSSLVPGQALNVALLDRGGRPLLETTVTTPAFGVREEVSLVVEQPLCQVAGRVFLPPGVTSRARIQIGDSLTRGPRTLAQYVRAEQDGTFVGRALATGETVRIFATAKDCAPYVGEIQLKPGVVRTEIVMTEAQPLVVKVVDEQGLPMAVDRIESSRGTLAESTDGTATISVLGTRLLRITIRHAGRTFTKSVDPATRFAPVVFELPTPVSVPLRVPKHVAPETVPYLRFRPKDHEGSESLRMHCIDGIWKPEQIMLYPGRYSVSWGPTDEGRQFEEWTIEPGPQSPRQVMR